MASSLNPLQRALERIVTALEETSSGAALVGGLAVSDLTVRVATRAHLIALKVLARDDRNRPQDWDDLRALLRDASLHDVGRARDALELIQRRGYNRGRNLSDDLDRAVVDTTR